MKYTSDVVRCFTLVVSITVLAVFAQVHSLHASIYYVDSVNGADTATGLTMANAWKTLTKVNSITFQPGDSLLFKRGCTWTGTVSFKGSGTSTAPISVDCYDSTGVVGSTGTGALPLFAGDSVSDFIVFLSNISYWQVADLEIRGGLRASIGVWCTTIPIGSQMNGITLKRLVIRNTSSRTGAPGAAIYCYNDGANQRTFNNLTITGCDIQNVARSGIYIQSSKLKADTTTLSYYNTNVWIYSNYIAQTHSSGITTSGCANVLIEYNTVDHAGSYLHDSTLAFVGIFPGSCLGGTIQYNVISNTDSGIDSQALDLDEWCAGVFYFQYNWTYNNYGGFFESTNNSLNNLIPGVTDRCIVQFNVSSNDDLYAYSANKNDVKLLTLTGQHHEFYYNTFYCATGPLIINKRWCNPPSFQAVFKNNIFYCPAGFYSCTSGGDNSTNPCTYDYNSFYSANGGLGTHQVNGDPQFLNPGNTMTGLQLRSTSPCVNAGVGGISNPSPQEDIYGFSYDLGTTLGADQLENVMRFEFENNLTDTSGHTNNGTLGGSGTTFPSTGARFGSYSLSLSGTGYVTVPNSTSTALLNDQLCIDLWVKISTTSGYRRLIDKVTSGSNDGFLLDITPSNQVRFNVRGYQVITSGTIATGTWTHVVALYTRSGTMSVYLNDIKDNQANAGNNPIWAASNTWPFRIGADQNGSQRLTGQLDSVQIRRSSAYRP